MFLDAVSRYAEASDECTNGQREHRTVFSRWEAWEPSEVSHHGSACCEIAREWLFNIDVSALNGSSLLSGPRWLRKRFEWGPGKYPIHWCEVTKKKALDCGVHAAVAHEVFGNRGIRSFRAQFVQEFSDAAGQQWRSTWNKDSAITAWIEEGRIYHEGCGVATGRNKIKIWDPSAGWWMDPGTVSGYGSVLALRICGRETRQFFWGSHRLETNVWMTLA